jgi:lactate racemase
MYRSYQMQKAAMPFGSAHIELTLPDDVEILSMGTPVALDNPAARILEALKAPVAGPGLDEIIVSKMKHAPDPRAVIVISDNTRPVPYTGENGILWPVVERLLKHGVSAGNITVLVATGMHRGLTEKEIRRMIDSRVLDAGVAVVNHDGKDQDGLTHLGTTARGSEVYINRLYVESDIRILTGLVESHFMAGASGGRKSICPGLIGEKSTFVFHGAEMMADPNSTDLKLEGNPCHEESFEVASIAGTDFIVNVTLDHQFQVTGVFAGELKAAHEAAVEHLKSYTAVACSGEYDIVLTHAGFVGINHYQAAKAGTVAARIVKPGGHVIMLADNSDTDPVGSLEYRTVLQLLTLNGPDAVDRILMSDDWTFIPEQWQVQMWNRLFRKIPLENFHYYSPQFGDAEYTLAAGSKLSELAGITPEGDPAKLLPELVRGGIENLKKSMGGNVRIAYLKDGPYGIPL